MTFVWFISMLLCCYYCVYNAFTMMLLCFNTILIWYANMCYYELIAMLTWCYDGFNALFVWTTMIVITNYMISLISCYDYIEVCKYSIILYDDANMMCLWLYYDFEMHLIWIDYDCITLLLLECYYVIMIVLWVY